MLSIAAIIGSGRRGIELASLLANSGIQVLLFDRGEKAWSSREALKGSRVALLQRDENLALIRAFNIDRDQDTLKYADWIFECVSEEKENLESVYKTISANASKHALIVSTSFTHTLDSISSMLDKTLAKRLFKGHFSFPLRQRNLVEWAYYQDVSLELRSSFEDVLWRILGRTVVPVKDGEGSLSILMETLFYKTIFTLLEKGEASVEEIDLLTGPVMEVSPLGSLRELSVGTLQVTLDNLRKLSSVHKSDADFWQIPLMEKMLYKYSQGAEGAGGFYLRSSQGIGVYRPQKDAYEKMKAPDEAEWNEFLKIQSPQARLASLYRNKGRAPDLFWKVTLEMLNFSSRLFPEMCESIYDFNRIVRYGLGWKMGPFEMWEALGLESVADRMKAEGFVAPEWFENRHRNHKKTFFTPSGAKVLSPNTEGKSIEHPVMGLNIQSLEKRGSPVEQGPFSRLWDTGNGVLLLEFTENSPLIRNSVLESIQKALSVSMQNGSGLIIGHEGDHFSPAGDLPLLFSLMSDKKYDELEKFLKAWQRLHLSIQHSPVPVATSVQGLCVGGGLGLAMKSNRVVAHSDTKFAFHEFGLGMIPAGGISVELMKRGYKDLGRGEGSASEKATVLLENFLNSVPTRSAHQAKDRGWLLESDVLMLHRQMQLAEAKLEVVRLFRQGYVSPIENPLIPVPGESCKSSLELPLLQLQKSQRISEFDAQTAKSFIHLISGAGLTNPSRLNENFLLEREVEINMSLLTRKDSLSRMQRILQGGA